MHSVAVSLLLPLKIRHRIQLKRRQLASKTGILYPTTSLPHHFSNHNHTTPQLSDNNSLKVCAHQRTALPSLLSAGEVQPPAGQPGLVHSPKGHQDSKDRLDRGTQEMLQTTATPIAACRGGTEGPSAATVNCCKIAFWGHEMSPFYGPAGARCDAICWEHRGLIHSPSHKIASASGY